MSRIHVCQRCNWIFPADCTCHPVNPVEVAEGAAQRLRDALARAARTDAWKRQWRAA